VMHNNASSQAVQKTLYYAKIAGIKILYL